MDDRQIISEYTCWPHWPYLPMKRSDQEYGFLFGIQPEDGEISLYTEHFQTPISASRTSIKKTLYSSIDAALKDGWLVDPEYMNLEKVVQ